MTTITTPKRLFCHLVLALALACAPAAFAAPAGPAVYGNAVSFDGVDDFVSATIPRALGSNYTVGAWVFIVAASANYEPAASVLSGNCGSTTELLVRTVGTNHFIELGRCGEFSGTLSTNSVPLLEWVHLAVTVTPGKQVSYFINGVASGTWDASTRDVTIASSLRLGDNLTRRFNGRLDDMRLWDTTLTRAQVVSAMNNGVVVTNHLVGHYRFDEDCDTLAFNSAPFANLNHGELQNGVTRITPSAASAPVAMTLPASLVGSTIATLNGKVTSGNTPASCWFEWGPTTDYGSTSAPVLLSGSAQTFTLRTAGFTPGTTNHFRVVAFNCAGTNFGADRTFITPAGLPRTNFIVTTVADSGPGSLRDATIEANSRPGPHTNVIQFAANLAGKTIRLTTGQLLLAGNLAIDASALPGGMRIDGNHAGRIIYVDDQSRVTLDSLTITNGGVGENASGGGIYNDEMASLTVQRCVITENSARHGGGIYNDYGGSLTLNQSTVSGNSTVRDGGGIYNGEECSLTLNECTVSGNSAGDDGGGIYNEYDVSAMLNRSTLSGNSAADEGGGIYNGEDGDLTLNQSTLSGNSARNIGGGIYNYEDSTLRLNQSTVSGNSSGGEGGGIYIEEDSDVTLFNSIVAGNVRRQVIVGLDSTGDTDESDALNQTLYDLGFGSRFINNGQWDGIDVVISYPGGGIGPDRDTIASGVNYIQISDHGSDWTPNDYAEIDQGADITVTLGTPHPITTGLPASWAAHGFWHYSPGASEDYVGWSTEEGLPSLASETSLVNQSRLLVAASLGLGKAAYIGWNVYGPDAGPNDVAVLRNAILWAVPPTRASNINREESYDLEGFNLTSGDPKLAPLGNYGGPTQTMPPLPGSPAIDGGAATDFITDQRGLSRFIGYAPDLGAVESTVPCLRAYYSFDSRTAVDETGNSTATHAGDCGARWGTDHFGRPNSAAWNSEDCGNHYLIETAAHPGNANLDLGLKGSFTVSAWIYPFNTGSDHWVLGNDGRGRHGALHLGLRDARAFLGFGDNDLDLAGQRTIPSNQWTHLVFTYNLLGGQMAIYVNGQLDAAAIGRPNTLGDRNLLIGWLEAADETSHFDGQIDDLAIYCQALAPNQIAALASDSVKPDELLPPADLPLPVPNGCVWSVREIYAHPTTPLDIVTAEYIASTAALGASTNYQSGVINFNDPQTDPDGGGFILGDLPYRSNNRTPGGEASGDDDNFVLAARTLLVITEEDDYTFGFSSDDGAQLRVKGAIFQSSTRLNSANPANPAHHGDTLAFPDNTADSATLGVAHLLPGTYEVEFLSWEVGGGAFCEVIWARGARTEFDSSFRLLGDTGSSALTATVTPFAQFITNGAPRTVQFSVQAGGFGETSYQWFFNGEVADAVNVSGVNSPTLIITGATADNAGTYSVRVANNLGQAHSGPALLALRNSVGLDTRKPSVTITSPAPTSLRVISSSIRLAGTARDNRAFNPGSQLTNVLAPGDPIVLVNGVDDGDLEADSPPPGEGVEHAIDRFTQKYLNFLDLGSGFASTPSRGLTIVSAARFYTANDSPERDPASYVVEGSSSGTSGPWTIIASGELALPENRNPGGNNPIDPAVRSHQLVSFDNAIAYASYRVTFPTLRDAANVNSMQIGEVELLGVGAEAMPPATVFVAVNGGPYLPASGSINWSLTLPLKPGTNVFQVIAVDAAGNVSKPETRTVFYSVSNELSVTASPGGTFAPNLNGKMLEVGRNYSMRAIAAKGYAFSNWTGGVLCSAPVINFPMSPRLMLQANFVRNPFAARAGNYNGLVHEIAGVRHDRSGFVSAKVTKDGGYSGSVKIDGKKLRISGKFDLGGNATNRLARTGTNALMLELQFDPNEPPRLLGRLTDGQWVASLIADLAPVVPRGASVPLAGKYTFGWDAAENTTGAPNGLSVGSIAVSSRGQATILTCFADGATATQSVPMPTNGPIPFYVDLYKGKGSALGWLYLSRSAPPGGAVFGSLNWYRPASKPPGLFTNGFEFLAAISHGSIYVAPTNNRVLNFRNGLLRITDEVSMSFTNPLVFGSGGNVTNRATNAMKMSVTTANGLFAGTTTEPGTGRKLQFKGAAFQDVYEGRGWWLGTNGSGPVYLAPHLNWASSVLGFSTQYRPLDWSAAQVLGAPDTYPAYGDIPSAWASVTPDGQAEYIELGFHAPVPIMSVFIYETYGPGAVNKVSVRNSTSMQWVEVWSGTASPAPPVARIFNVTFPLTAFPVDGVRLDVDSPAVPDWNEIDAVGLDW